MAFWLASTPVESGGSELISIALDRPQKNQPSDDVLDMNIEVS